ncbi:hypothetical protein [Oligosphaera ethanolica]|uniref:Asl1-like glycosyl hydrolase catalytic domain-containing protein n=1 Tax=Oligosphaera ethanolica TaxID=760260 RepID=A0AAE3VEW1_9BACT|nr:hypothetical protein [Oligosphaera ethanolica]MDQ0289214.1 hypothetical protein [Oligosphaera ethanolica]
MMKQLTAAILASALSIASLAAAPAPQTFPAPADLLQPERWEKNSSGAMSIAFDADEQALVFDVKFHPDVDHWIYPGFRLGNGETLHGADAISFELKISPQDDYQGLATANVMLAGLHPYQAPEPGQWQDITVKLPGATSKGQEEAMLFRVGMNPKHDSHRFALRNIRFHGTPQRRYIAPVLATAAPGAVWLEQEEPTFTINAPLDNLRYVLKNWHGTVLKESTWPDGGDSPLVFPPMSPGYYLLETSHDGADQLAPYSFVVVIDPARRPKTHRSFFGTDSAQSWLAKRGNFACPWYDGDTFKLISELIYRAGVPHVRERLSWPEVNPNPGEYDYGHYLYNANLLHERGILISGMFHNAPAWAGRKIKLPLDLREVYIFCKKTAEVFGDRMGNWEYWNEQDIGFAPEPAWDFAASMKAAYLGFKAARPNMPVAIGALCRPDRNAYDYGLFANDIAKYTDLMNFHTYAGLASYPNIFAEMRQFMADHGIADRPLWITECGTNAEGPATADSGKDKLKKHSPDQEMVLAEFLPKSQILLMLEGVARNYYFVFPPYNERGGHKDWGLMRRDGTVKPGYAAFATITAQLLEAALLGEINTDDQTRAFLFQQPDGSQTVVFWSKSAVDTGGKAATIAELHAADISLALPAGDYVLTDLVGTAQALTVAGNAGATTLRATRFPQYLAGLRGLKADQPPHSPGTTLTNNATASDDLSVIVHLDLNPDDVEIGGIKSMATLYKNSARGTLTLWNLDHTPKNGRLLVSGAAVGGLPDSISIAPMGKALFAVVITPELPAEGYNTSLTIVGSFNDKKISKFHLPMLLFGDLVANCDEIKLNTAQPENWRQNDSGTTSNMVYDETEQAMRFDISWNDPGVDRWFYPEHVLTLPDESFAGASMLAFEVKSSQDKVENDFRYNYLMLVTENVKERGDSRSISYRAPLHDWETRYVPLDGAKIPLDSVKMFRLGANPIGQQLTYWVRNIRLLKPRQ